MVAGAAQFEALATGECSFCGKDRRELPALIGSRDPRILVMGMPVRICEPCLGLCCSILEGAVGDTRDKKPAPKRQLPPWAADGFCCSFCGAPEDAVAKLVFGPRVFMCETCVGAAVAFLQQS